MPVAVHPQPILDTMSLPNQPRPQPLRRAVYIHVSDLTSAYNIDHSRLEEELKRVKEELGKPPEESSARLDVPTVLDTSVSQRRLQPPRAGYNLCVLVGNVNIVVDKNRVDGTRVRLAEVEVGDETGIVSLRARDEQIDILQQVSERSGGAAVLRNCTLELYQGKHLRLTVTKWGKLCMYPDYIASTPPPPSKINRDRNFSLIDLSLVASEMVTFAPEDPYQQNVESENQASSVTNRQQQYHQSSSFSRRGRRGPSHGNLKREPAVASPRYDPGMLNPMSYPTTGLHGYSGIEGTPYSYATRQQEKPLPVPVPVPQQQHQLMFHQQYEMQQRQMQQMYTSPSERLQTGVLMSSGVPPAASFDAYNSTPDASMSSAPGPNPFLTPVQSGTSSPRRQSNSPFGDSPGKMNPQAATFDPSNRM